MDICPVCHKDAQINWKKLIMSPLAPMPCESCNAELSVSWADYVKAVAPGSLVFLAAYILMEESIAQYSVYALGIALMLFCQMRMPLGLSENVPAKPDNGKQGNEQQGNGQQGNEQQDNGQQNEAVNAGGNASDTSDSSTSRNKT